MVLKAVDETFKTEEEEETVRFLENFEKMSTRIKSNPGGRTTIIIDLPGVNEELTEEIQLGLIYNCDVNELIVTLQRLATLMLIDGYESDIADYEE